MSIPKDMTAAFITSTGGIDKIHIGLVPVPQVGPTDVLVRLEATEVNHVDLFVRSGAYHTPLPFPFVIGRDLVGTVKMTGDGVEAFTPGERVWCNSLGHAGRQGSFAQYAAVPVERLYHLPDGVDPDDAAVVLHAAGTAHIGLVREACLQPGETVLVGAASGAVGSAIVQLASAIGARVVAGGGPRDVDLVAECGATTVVDEHADNYYEQVGDAAPDGVDVWWDTKGRYDLHASVPLLAHGGRMMVMASLDAAPTLPVGMLYTRDASLLGFAISNASVTDLAAAAKSINHLLATGKLKGRVGATFHLADADKAHEALESGGVRGRILVIP